ncbi:putative sensor kinase CitA, partial [Vibrio parahaemolyticus V-223/04]
RTGFAAGGRGGQSLGAAY